MSETIPSLLIIISEIAVVLAIITIIIVVRVLRQKKADLDAINQLSQITNLTNDNRKLEIKTLLKEVHDHSGNIDEESEKLLQVETDFIKTFSQIYLERNRDPQALLTLRKQLSTMNNHFFTITKNTSGSANATEVAALSQQCQELDQEKMNLMYQIQQLEKNNNNVNEHLNEALETLTTLVTEYGHTNPETQNIQANEILKAILHLRQKIDPTASTPTTPAATSTIEESLVDDKTIVGETFDTIASSEPATQIVAETETETNITAESTDNTEEEDADALWQEAFSEQAAHNNDNIAEEGAEDDLWAAALKEQAEKEHHATTQTDTLVADTSTESQEEDADALWQEAFSEQAAHNNNSIAEEGTEDDPWAAALKEQAEEEAQATAQKEAGDTPPDNSIDPWEAALKEQEEEEKQQKKDNKPLSPELDLDIP